MIFVVHIIKLIKQNVLLCLILLLAVFIRLYEIPQIFPFDYDQQVPAQAAYDFFRHQQISLIGQELSFQGFFLGPLHNWIQFLPYGLCSLKPDCVPYFYLFISTISTVLIYLVIKSVFNKKVALVSACIYAFSYLVIETEIGVNSNYFLHLCSVSLIYCLNRYYKNDYKYLIIGSFIGGLATVNFNPVFIFSVLSFFVASFFKKRTNFKIFTIAIFAFLINFAPLIVFNFRHSNLILNSLEKFFTQNSGATDYLQRLVFIIEKIAGPYYADFLFQYTGFLSMIFLFIVMVITLRDIYKKRDKITIYLFCWILITIFGFAFYKSHIPPYYFQQTLIPVAILIAIALTKKTLYLAIFISAFVFGNLSKIFTTDWQINYKYKKAAVEYIIKKSDGEKFNVYYDLPFGLNTGYSYLFNAYGRIPEDYSRRLFIIDLENPSNFDFKSYQETYKQRQVGFTRFGHIYVISVE